MNRDDVTRWARQVGYPIQHSEWQKATEEFAALVAAAEREACAKVCEELETCSDAEFYGHEFAAAIRARGQPQ